MSKVKNVSVKSKNADSSSFAGESTLKLMFTHYSKCEGISYSAAQKEIREKQIYIVIGEESTAGSSLLSIKDLTFTCEFPPQESQLLHSSGAGAIQWRISDTAAWVQIPASFLEPSQQDELFRFYQALAHFRPQNTVDGVVFVCPAELMLSGSREELNVTAARYQKQLILLDKNLGVTPPVYFIFDRADAMPGFWDIFGDASGKWDEQILGANLQPAERKSSIREILGAKLTGLEEQVRVIELKMLAREKDDAVRRGISEFSSAYASLRTQLNDFMTQLLSPAGSKDLNPLGGFFFAASASNRKGEACSFFAKQIFRAVIPSARTVVSHTTDKIRDMRKKTVIYTASAAAAVLLFVGLIFWGTSSIKKWEDQRIKIMTAEISGDAAGLTNMTALYRDYTGAEKFLKGKRTFAMRVLGYNPEPVSEAVRARYLLTMQKVIGVPAGKFLQKKLYRAVIDGSSDLSNQFMPLKSALRAYLAGSDMGAKYPDLYDAPLLKEELYPITAPIFYGTAAPDKDAQKKIDQILTAYISMLKTSVLKPAYTADAGVVSKTQERLVTLFDAEVVYQTTIEQLKRKGANQYLFDLVPEANEVNMNSGSPLHDIYTPKAWKSSVGSEIKNASGRVASVEKWVVGNNQSRMSGSFTDPAKLYRGMVAYYLNDTRARWMTFFKSINLYRFNSLSEAGLVMSKLGSGSSALVKTFSLFNSMTEEYKALGTSEKEGDLFIGFADSLKCFSQILGNIGAYQGFIGKTGEAVEEQRKTKSLSSVFNGGASDPLASLHGYTAKTMIAPLSASERDVFGPLLFQPSDRAEKALSKAIAEELNSLWTKSVHQPFVQNFSGKYPFASSAKFAEYSAVMDYYAPNSDFWKLFSDRFAGFLSKSDGRWYPSSQGSGISVRVRPDAVAFINRAEEIKRIFFLEDGSRRVWRFGVTPTNRNQLSSAVMTVGEISGDVMIPGIPKFEWPESKGLFSMKFTDSRGNPAAAQKYGEWVVMQELNNASLASLSQKFSTRIPAQFTIKANALQLNLPAEIQVSSQWHPFSQNPFTGIKSAGAFCN